MATNTRKNTKAAKKPETTKKTSTLKQIEELEKALKDGKLTNVQTPTQELDPQLANEPDKVIKAASEDEIQAQPETNIDDEVKEILTNTEPSDEVKEQIEDFEKTQTDFAKQLDENPEKAEQIVEEEIKKMEQLKQKAETIKANIQKVTDRNFRNEGFTSWWNGSSGLY
jgi:hypothetical protein